MKKLFFYLSVFICVSHLKAQVNLQNGSSSFTLPMFNWQDDDSRLNAIVALNYNSGSGLKVSEVASNVGQGWNLIAGGVITRIQAGEPDDQKPLDGTSEDEHKYPPGYLYDPADASLGAPLALTRYPIYEDKNHVYREHNSVAADKEQDKFAFSFNGKSGLFILDKYNMGTGILLGDSKVKVWFTKDENMPNTRTTITAFYIQDENGLIYKFTQHELTKVLKTNYADGSLTGTQVSPNFKSGHVYDQANFDNTGIVNPYIINGWYLTEIEDVLTHRKINFTYVNRSVNAQAGTTVSYNWDRNYSIVSHNTSITETPEIAGINYPDGHQVTFNYGVQRIDLAGEFAMESVDITYQNRSLAKYQLNTSYFILNRYGTPVSDYQKSVARLCLLSVKKIGVDLAADDAPYLFDYNTGSNNADDIVPPPFSHLKDIWGFYNGDYSMGYNGNTIPLSASLSELGNDQLKGLCFQRNGITGAILNAKSGYAANGLLKKITYPTGGTLSYNYSQNTAQLNGQETNVGGVHVSQTSVTDGGYSNDCTNPIITSYNYTNESNNQSSMWGVEAPNNVMYSVNHYEPELKHYHWGVKGGCAPIGCCQYKYKYPGILSSTSAFSLTSQQKTLETISAILDVVGIVMEVVDVAAFIMGGPIGPVIVDIVANLVTLAISCFSDYSKDYYTTTVVNYDLNAANPLPAQFKRVVVTESSGQNGRTVTEFTSDSDYPVWYNTNPAFASKQRYAYWAYGLPKKTTVYNAGGDKVKQTENIYDTTNARSQCLGGVFYDPKVHQTTYWGKQNAKSLVIRSASQRNTDWDDPAHYDGFYQQQSSGDMLVDMYAYCTGRMPIATTYERTFKQTDPTQYLETKTEYTYNPYNFQVSSIRTTETSGDIKIKNITYSDDHSAGADIALGLLKSNGITVPLATATEVIKSGATNTGVLNEAVTEFTVTASGDIKPTHTIERRFAAPFYNGPTSSVYDLYQYPGCTQNPVGYKEIQKFTYDANSKLIGIKDEGDRMGTNIYDYNNKYVIASVVNADAALDKCAYTSFETPQLGGWSLTGAATYSTTSAVTGSAAFVLSGGNSVAANLNTAKAYRLSFWSTTGTVTVSNGSSLVKSAPTINGFTYYEYDIAQGTGSITVSGSGTIDELRLYPSTSRMRTVSYDPLIGKTSECDENNRITYYQYDEHGRMKFIKDDAGNIVKMYEYNLAVKKQNDPCSVMYYNKAVSEIFTRNNCGAGYIGTKVLYTIPANKYSSTVNQAIADMQAQEELNSLGQAYANNNGSCLQVYYNVARVDTFWKQACAIGYKGTYILYTVPTNKYTSIISQADADDKALDETSANGQAYANKQGNASCIIDNGPDWIGTGETQCETSNGVNTGNMLFKVIDQNPNSSTYNQTQWTNGGPSTLCPAGMGSGNNITIDYINPGNNTASVLFQGQSGQQYTFNMGPYVSSPTILGQIPAGVYMVKVSVPFVSSGNTVCFFINAASGYTCTSTTSMQPYLQTAWININSYYIPMIKITP